MIIDDPWFYVAAVPAVLLSGINKGGFGSGLGILSVPLMALAIPPLQAAAILLPMLCLMDLVGVWAYRHRWDRGNLKILLPGAMLGILSGALTAGFLSDHVIRLLVGLIAAVFAVNYYLGFVALEPRGRHVPAGMFWGATAGYTSFLAHAGGPPLVIYLLPQRLDKTLFVGTTVIFWAVVNYVKLIPYAWLGQFDSENLATALLLCPLAPLGMWLGIRLHKLIPQLLFYRICYALTLLVGLKLVWDGARLGRLFG
jgi:uncharacterized membrane protein YfcA